MELSSELLAEYALDVTIEDLPEDVVEQVERLTLDTIGCCFGGFTSPPSKILRRTYGSRASADACATIFGTGGTADTEYAAFINSAMGRYLDFNDCYTSAVGGNHPSDHIPALISVAEAEGASGADLIEAVVVAYEIQCRGLDTGSIFDLGFDYVTWGAYSATAAAGALMGLDREELIDAIGIAGTANNTLLISRLGEVSMWKGVAMPYVIHNGIQACQLARNGLTGPEHVFEGDCGFFETVARDEVELEALGGRDGAGYRVMETSFKPFACGYYTQPSVTAVLDAIQENDVEVDDIESIDVRTFDTAVQVYASGPEKWATDLNRETADHSLPYNVAVAVLDGEVTPEQYDEAHLSDEAVHAMMQKVSVDGDAELDRHRRENPRHVPAFARVTTSDGTFEKRVNYPIGHPERPMSTEQLEGKAAGQMEPFLSDDQICDLFDACYSLREADDLTDIVENVVA